MRVHFIDETGAHHDIDGAPGETLMRCATDHAIAGIIGECGGAMACATCHAYLAEPWFGRAPPPSAQEREMLSGCIGLQANSRLTCQVRLDASLDGIIVEVPNSQV
jgi:2Fe-2S ferredoxin